MIAKPIWQPLAPLLYQDLCAPTAIIKAARRTVSNQTISRRTIAEHRCEKNKSHEPPRIGNFAWDACIRTPETEAFIATHARLWPRIIASHETPHRTRKRAKRPPPAVARTGGLLPTFLRRKPTPGRIERSRACVQLRNRAPVFVATRRQQAAPRARPPDDDSDRLVVGRGVRGMASLAYT